jgi:hypothetical protein
MGGFILTNASQILVKAAPPRPQCGSPASLKPLSLPFPAVERVVHQHSDELLRRCARHSPAAMDHTDVPHKRAFNEFLCDQLASPELICHSRCG